MYAGGFVWSDLARVAPHTWYRLTIVKAPGSVRVFVDGKPRHTSTQTNYGVPNSGIVLGASTWRGAGSYGEHMTGAIASLSIWARALSDAEITGYPVDRGGRIVESQVAAVSELSLAGARPNPARGGMVRVHFALPDEAPARLDLLDVTGRRVAGHDLGTLGAGRHAIALGQNREIRPGVYWLRLAHGNRALTSKVVVAE
jgi:hypothetical protein